MIRRARHATARTRRRGKAGVSDRPSRRPAGGRGRGPRSWRFARPAPSAAVRTAFVCARVSRVGGDFVIRSVKSEICSSRSEKRARRPSEPRRVRIGRRWIGDVISGHMRGTATSECLASPPPIATRAARGLACGSLVRRGRGGGELDLVRRRRSQPVTHAAADSLSGRKVDTDLHRPVALRFRVRRPELVNERQAGLIVREDERGKARDALFARGSTSRCVIAPPNPLPCAWRRRRPRARRPRDRCATGRNERRRAACVATSSATSASRSWWSTSSRNDSVRSFNCDIGCRNRR